MSDIGTRHPKRGRAGGGWVNLQPQRAWAGQWADLGREKRVHVSVLNVRCQHLINAWHHCVFRLGQADKLRETADGWPPSSEIRPISLLGIQTIQKPEISILTLKTLCVSHWGSYYHLVAVGPTATKMALTLVHSFMKWLGHCGWGMDGRRSGDADCISRKLIGCQVAAETCVIAHLSGNLMCSEASKVPHGPINDSLVCLCHMKHWFL